MISAGRVYDLCKEHGWYTDATNTQINKLIYMVQHGASLQEIATIIWLCSNEEKYTRREILAILKKEEKK